MNLHGELLARDLYGLLDVLAEASMGWNESEGHGGGLYQKVVGVRRS